MRLSIPSRCSMKSLISLRIFSSPMGWNSPFLHHLVEGRPQADRKGDEPYVIGFDFIEDPRRLDGVLARPEFSSETGHDIFAKRDPRRHEALSTFDVVLRSRTLADELENSITSPSSSPTWMRTRPAWRMRLRSSTDLCLAVLDRRSEVMRLISGNFSFS